MLQPISKGRRSLIVSLAILLLAGINFAPLTAFADSSCTPPDSSQPGSHRPVGADAGTYSYNCGTGMWENAHYTYNPATGTTASKDPVVYTYNSATGQYDTTTWAYNAPSGSYVARTQSVSQPPAGATVVGGPAPAVPASPAASSGSTGGGSANKSATVSSNGNANGGITSSTGSGSYNNTGGSANSSSSTNNTTGASINNLDVGQASSGNALVIGNTTAGNATSGNAQDIANVVNMLQSSSNILGGNAVTFVANIDGDVNGDFLIDPSLLSSLQPASSNDGSSNAKTTINNNAEAAINNTINLAATSGDASVSNNTTAGNAASGQAQAIANVVNVINSAISGGNSFMGVININGNLNGDILMPPGFIDQLVASNVPTVSIDTSTPSSGTHNVNVTNTNNSSVSNNVTASANSGHATVVGNTTAGDATSGSAKTNITAFNLTGSNVIGANDLLVFVNVLGNWVGMIVNAPSGSTAAELGGGITGNTTDAGTNSTTIDNKNNQTITNNITASAQSGDASVTHNTTAGSATSGNASVAVNLLNVENSNLSLTNWFGILFINVFGNWNGSFGVNTSAGDPVGSSPGDVSGSSSNVGGGPPMVFRFVPTSGGSAHKSGGFGLAPVIASSNSAGASSTAGTDSLNNSVLAAHTDKSGGASGGSSRTSTPGLSGSDRSFLSGSAAIIGGLILLYALFELFLGRRAAARKAAEEPAAVSGSAAARSTIELYEPGSIRGIESFSGQGVTGTTPAATSAGHALGRQPGG
jgi:hypothetical protein